MFKKIVAILALTTLLAYSAVKFPYPQRKNYPGGTINVTSASASGDLKAKFTNFVRDFYETGTCGSTACARIKFDETQYTVSEGIGYAMIMMVYFSDATTSYQDHFDKLWAYYNNFKNNNGVMHWKIQGFSSVNQQNGATDAELDVAIALAMARYQFDDVKYENAAKSLIDIIWSKEMNSDGLHKPGDGWDNDKNPSYVSPAAFEIFKSLGNSANWTSALSRNYTFLKANQNGTSGLPSNWANSDGSVKECSYCGYTSRNYGQDAVRAPWRWAWSKAWFGHSDANTLLTKLATWVNGKNAADVKGPIPLDGNGWGTDANASYIGSLMNALMVNSTYQAKLNSYWSVLSGISEPKYFNAAMQILTGLLATGNMPNLKDCASATGCGTNMSNGGGGTKDYTSLSKFDWFGVTTDAETIDVMGFGANLEPWIAYTDASGSNGATTLTNPKYSYKDENNNCESGEGYRAVEKDGNEWVAKITYTFGQGKNRYAPFAALGLEAKSNGKTYDLSKCTGGFSYKYKGQGHNFKVKTTPIPETSGADYFKAATVATTEWTERVVEFTDLAQPTWASAAQKVPFKAEEIYGFHWEAKGSDATCPTASAGPNLNPPKPDNYCENPTPGTTAGISANTGFLAIKDFRCLGQMPLPASRTNLCGALIEGPGDDDGGEIPPVDPIISQPYAANNAFAVRNGVNLQISKKAIVEIFSLNGKSISKREFSNGNYTLMLNDLPKGLYVVKVQFSSHQWEILRVPVR